MLSIVRNGTEYSLDDGTYCKLISDDGAGMLPMHRLSERGPLQHGNTDVGFYYDPRIIMLMLAVYDDTIGAMESKRLALINIFAPQPNPLILKYTLDDGSIRQIDCHYIDGLSMPHQDTFKWIKTPVNLICPDPTFYDPSAQSIGFNISAGADTWQVPFAIPLQIGASVIDSKSSFTYSGNAPSYPIIRITGPAADPILTIGYRDTDYTLNFHTLSFSGGTISAGDYYEIDLRYGRKTVVDKGGTSQLSKLTSTSDIANWQIAPDPYAAGGINSMSFSCSGATTATKCEITYYDRYIGV